MNIFILTFHKYDKAFASDLYLIYNRSPAARVCKSDTDRLLMLYLVLISYMYLYTLFNNYFNCIIGTYFNYLFNLLICYYYFLTIFNLFGQYYIHYLLAIVKFNKLGCVLTIYYLFLNYIITIFELIIDYLKLC